MLRRILVLVVAGVLAWPSLGAQVPKLSRRIPLPGVEGRIDHLAVDPAGGRVFVAALGHNTVEVVDTKASKVLQSLGGFAEPQGVLFVPGTRRLYVANGGDGSLRVIDTDTFATVATVQLTDDADNVRYDAAARQVVVGFGNGGLGFVDEQRNTLAANIALAGHPESFQLDAQTGRIFVNIPRAHGVALLDGRTRKVTGLWKLTTVAGNYALALDEANRRVFVACRTPARVLVYDAETGREITRLTLHGDCDDLFYDPGRRQLYAACGEGFLDIFTQSDGDHYTLKKAIQTAARARTAAFAGDVLFLAVPRRGDAAAELQVFEFPR